jgi:hypothetical protein
MAIGKGNVDLECQKKIHHAKQNRVMTYVIPLEMQADLFFEMTIVFAGFELIYML